MKILDLFKKKFRFLGLDIGPSSIKYIELSPHKDTFKVEKIGNYPLQGEVYQNNILSQPQVVGEAIQKISEQEDFNECKVSFAVPAPSVFTKVAKLSLMKKKELAENILLEAGNVIPHALSAVKLDYHVLRQSGKNNMDVLLIAAKNEVVEKIQDAIMYAGIDAGICDVEYFALQNAFEENYPELLEKTVALIEVGSRYSAVNIVRNGQSLFTGDVPTGGKMMTESLAEIFGMSVQDAEKLKRLEPVGDERLREAALEILNKNVENLAAELHRQLTFFWNASDMEGGVDKVFLSGGAAHTRGLVEMLQEKSGIETEILNPFKRIILPDQFKNSIGVPASYTVSVGLGLRNFGDKETPDFL